MESWRAKRELAKFAHSLATRDVPSIAPFCEGFDDALRSTSSIGRVSEY